MVCDGGKEIRDGLIADMVLIQEGMTQAAVLEHLQSLPASAYSDSNALVMTMMGYLGAHVERLAAAVIALAGPCCEDCDDDELEDPTIGLFQQMPKQGWSNPNHDVMADLREAHDGFLVDRDGAPDE